MRFGKGATIFVFAQVLAFTVVCLWFAWYEKALPDALIYGFYAWFGAEGGCLAWLKIAERKQKKGDPAALKKEKADLEKKIAALKKQLAKVQKAAGINGQQKLDGA